MPCPYWDKNHLRSCAAGIIRSYRARNRKKYAKEKNYLNNFCLTIKEFSNCPHTKSRIEQELSNNHDLRTTSEVKEV